jgi:hypothetical protein
VSLRVIGIVWVQAHSASHGQDRGQRLLSQAPRLPLACGVMSACIQSSPTGHVRIDHGEGPQ